MSKWPRLYINSPWNRLALIPPESKDDIHVAALRSNPETIRYLPFLPRSITPEEWRIKREARSAKEEIWDFHIHFLSQVAPDKSISSFVGQCGLIHIDTANRSAEVGIVVSPKWHRSKIASEALYMTLKHAFEYPDLKMHRVQFTTAPDNVQMRGWLENYGIKMEYRLREAWVDGKGGWIDSVGYSILESEWPALKKKLEEKLNSCGGQANG
ncbi:acyl-CoA N-acyltransferase [Hysterangium stoloniferum]|nr:acyl-CoA N-acyltransferase [Hysterangium stoloniferum]